MDSINNLYLENETFEDARQKFNTVLQKLLKNMVENKAEEGSITLKLDVVLDSEVIPNNDPDIEGETREIQLPSFSYKVSSAISIKDEVKGMKNPQMELVWDEDTSAYVLKYVANTSQRSIFDKDFEENMKNDSDDKLETSSERDYLNVPQISGPVADESALPGEVTEPGDEDIIDGEFRELGEDSENGDNSAECEEYEENPDEEPETAPDGENEADEADYKYEEPEESGEDEENP